MSLKESIIGFGMRIEDLEVWKRSVRLCADVYKNLHSLNDFVYKSQITRSALSISSNIAEGFERESDKECVRFLIYSKGSCGELRSQIYIGLDIGYIKRDMGRVWLNDATEISKMLSGLIKTKRKYIQNKSKK